MSEVKLPHFVLNRNHTLISKTGLAVRFEKGVARPVQLILVPEVVGIGAERVDGEQGEGQIWEAAMAAPNLKLDNLTVIHKRAEEFQPAQPFTGIISRAFSSMENFTNWTRHLGNSQTQWLAMKGLHPADELVALPADFHLDSEHALAVPGCQGQRHLLILRRTA